MDDYPKPQINFYDPSGVPEESDSRPTTSNGGIRQARNNVKLNPIAPMANERSAGSGIYNPRGAGLPSTEKLQKQRKLDALDNSQKAAGLALRDLQNNFQGSGMNGGTSINIMNFNVINQNGAR